MARSPLPGVQTNVVGVPPLLPGWGSDKECPGFGTLLRALGVHPSRRPVRRLPLFPATQTLPNLSPRSPEGPEAMDTHPGKIAPPQTSLGQPHNLPGLGGIRQVPEPSTSRAPPRAGPRWLTVRMGNWRRRGGPRDSQGTWQVCLGGPGLGPVSPVLPRATHSSGPRLSAPPWSLMGEAPVTRGQGTE